MQTNGEIKKATSTGDQRYPCNIAYTVLAPCRALVNLTNTCVVTVSLCIIYMPTHGWGKFFAEYVLEIPYATYIMTN